MTGKVPVQNTTMPSKKCKKNAIKALQTPAIFYSIKMLQKKTYDGSLKVMVCNSLPQDLVIVDLLHDFKI